MGAPSILAIAGPTASGKTGAAIELAQRLGGELVGCDSVQVYRGFDIGSAKPTASELGSVRHHLLDVIDADEELDAARYAALADRAIDDIAARGRLPIVVGGTGLWMRALLRGLVDLPAPDPEIRARFEAEADRIGAPALHARLASIDPRAAAAIHPNDRLRIVRALEVHAQTGEPLGELQARHALGAPRYRALVVVLDRERDTLYDAVKVRIHDMLARGWVDEVRGLLERWGPAVRPLGSVGYREVVQHIVEGASLAETERLAYKSTRIYTRRQRTWWGSERVDLRTSADALLAPEGMEVVERFLAPTTPP